MTLVVALSVRQTPPSLAVKRRLRLAGLTAEQQAAVEALTRSLTNKFLHAPMTALREAARDGDAQALAELESLYTNQSRNKQ